jgi:hypothetical protein
MTLGAPEVQTEAEGNRIPILLWRRGPTRVRPHAPRTATVATTAARIFGDSPLVLGLDVDPVVAAVEEVVVLVVDPPSLHKGKHCIEVAERANDAGYQPWAAGWGTALTFGAGHPGLGRVADSGGVGGSRIVADAAVAVLTTQQISSHSLPKAARGGVGSFGYHP